MSIATFLSRPRVQRIIGSVLRSHFPVLRFRKNVVISRYDDVLQILRRDQDFTISEINGKKMDDLELSFFLGMDASEQHTKEYQMMHQAVKREDLNIIKLLVETKSDELLEKALHNRQIDVVNDYARKVPLHLIESYFGIPVHDEKKFLHWMRILFYQLFLNLSNDKKIKSLALIAASELKIYLEKVISERKTALANNLSLEDNVLNRLLIIQQNSKGVTDDAIRRNISGYIIGSVETTSKATVHTLQELLKRPLHLKQARSMAIDNNIQMIGRYMLELLRFNPHNTVVIRWSKVPTTVLSKGKTYNIPAGCMIYAGISLAMFDKEVFVNPNDIDLGRKVDYLHFSYGLHSCAGRYINMVQIPTLVSGILKLQNIRFSNSVKKNNIEYEGPFPSKFNLEFDA